MLAMAAVASTQIYAQEFRGTVLGRVTDSSGAVVPNAKVTLTNEETNVSTAAMSNAEGNYIVPFVLPGRYTVTVELSGFRTFVRKGITVAVNDRVPIDVTLDIGATTEAVTVTADAPLIEQANADMGQVVQRNYIEKLAMSGRNAMNLADLAGGVLAGSGDYTSNSQNDITINGGSGDRGGNEITVDGIPNMNPRQGGLAVTVPIADAVEEFKVSTTMFDASLGRSNGGALSFSTRSGTNELHGSAYDFYQNRALNANSWTNNRNGLPKPPVNYNLWGGTIGGPVYLPKIYDGRNKSFFFFYYETATNKRPISRYGRVPTELERMGDFSQTLSPTGVPLAIYDPFSTVVSGNTVTRTAFAGARIPANRIDPTGAAVLAQLPMPNMPGPARIGSFNWTASTVQQVDVSNLGVRFDHNISDRQRIYARISALNRDAMPNPQFFPGNYDLPSSTSSRTTADLNMDPRRNRSFALDDSYSFSPTFFGSFRYGYVRTGLTETFDGTGRDTSILRLPAQIVANQTVPGWPIFNLGENMPYIGSRARSSNNDTHAGLATFNKLVGRHALKFGVDYRLVRWNEANPGTSASGTFTFNSTFTRSDPAASSASNTSGASMASLLLGVPASGSLGYVSALSLQSHYWGLFIQDDFKVSPRLTINLGLRYELETPYTERYNRISVGFDESAELPFRIPGMQLRGGLLFSTEDNRRQGKIDGNNFGPRVGLAYTLTPKTVLRSGYGIFYSSGIVNAGTLGGVASFNAITNYVGSTDGNRTPFTTIQNPFPTGIVQPTGNSLGIATEAGNSITFIDPNRKLPYIQQWQFSIQRELPFQSVIETAYVGTHAIGLLEDFNLNERPDRFLALGTAEFDPVPNPFLRVLPETSTLGRGNTLPQSRFWVRFPQFNAVNVSSMNAGRSLYHSFQLRFQKRFSRGLSLVTTYTHSRNMQYEMTSVINERDYRSVSEVDRPNMFRLFATYELPFGRSRAVGANWPRLLDAIAGGWELSGFYRWTSGDPLSIDDRRGRPIPIRNPVLDGPVSDRIGDRIDPATRRPLNPYFDTTAWASLPSDYSITPEPLRYGWLRGPASWSSNLTLFKVFSLTERVRFELRGELNNPTNSVVFDNPGTDLANPSTFGVINDAGGPRTVMVAAKIRF
jgi:hypothetical protein